MSAPRQEGQAPAAPRSIHCPHCGRQLKITDELIGRKFTCAACHKKINLVAPGARGKGPPPVPAAARPWYLHVHGRNVGPYSADTVREQLDAGKVDATTLAWREGQAEWQPIGEIEELAPPAAPRKPAPKATERRRRYVPGRGKRDVVVGAWVAVGLAVVLLVIVLVTTMGRDDETGGRRRKTRRSERAEEALPQNLDDKSGESKAKDKPLVAVAGTPRSELSHEQLLTALEHGLKEDFEKAIEAHKAGDVRPILRLAQRLDRWADDLGARQWNTTYEKDIELLRRRLDEASQNIEKDLPKRTVGWEIPGTGVDPKYRAERLGFNNTQWLENWRDHIQEVLARLHEKGVDF
ncbi:MAG: GYF domain-containing protein [Candidatus Brocadiia bacterium]